MRKMGLDQRVVDQLSAPDPSGKQKIYWDRGFGVRCSGKTNGKSYVVQHDLPDGRAKRITIGSANLFSIAEAKERARKVLSRFYSAVDPETAKQVATTAYATSLTPDKCSTRYLN
jgi:Arm DNA-binding domain